jgi:hypothetical protein
MRLLLALVFAGITAYVGASWVAHYKLEERLSLLREDAKSICSERGTSTPSVERLREKLEALAAMHAVELSELEVSVHAIDAAHDTGPGAQVQAGLSAIPGMRVTGKMAEAHARMHAKQWLWHAREALSTSCTLERKIERVLPSSFGVEPQ